MSSKILWVICFFVLIFGCNNFSEPTPKVLTGLDNIDEYSHLFKNKRVGIITNHTAFNSRRQYITDIFLGMRDVKVTALFGPEHGIRGSAEAGEKVDTGNDPLSNIPIYSLYGKTRKPTAEMLEDIDVLVFDIQDIGARFYTYIYSMSLAMEAAAEHGKPFVVLDRPNPINGIQVEGNVLESQYSTFVGLYPIPVRHGMTVGELAMMFNQEGWLQNGAKADLTVIPLGNWKRSQWYDETGLVFIKPSPNIPDLISASVYPGVCLLEGTNISEGRGTDIPFQLAGAPWIDGAGLAAQLNAAKLPGVIFKDTVFTPLSIPGASTNPKYQDKLCYGVQIRVVNRDMFEPYLTGIHIVNTINQIYPDSFKWKVRHFDRLCGSSMVREAIIHNQDLYRLTELWQTRLKEFMAIRRKYLIYE